MGRALAGTAAGSILARSRWDRSALRWLTAALVLAFAIRVAGIAVTPHLPLLSDPADYARHARSIAGGDGYPASPLPAGGPTAIRPPGFPFFLAAVFAITGDSVTAARFGVAVLGVVIVLLIALLTDELFGRRPALIAAFLAACYPSFVVRGLSLWAEPLFVVFLLGAVLAMFRWRAAPATRYLIAAGVLAGAAILTRQNGAVLLIPLALAAHRGSWRRASTYAAPAVMVACAVLVVLPWTIRNAVVMHAFVPVSTQDGFTLVGTYNATSRAKYDGAWITPNLDPTVRRIVAANRSTPEVTLDRRLRAEARRFAVSDPPYVAKVVGTNLLRLFQLTEWSRQRDGLRVTSGLGRGWADAATFGFLPFLVLAVVGIALGGLRRGPPWLWAIPALMATTVFVVAYDRFRAPIDPFLIALAAYGVSQLAARLQARAATTRR